MVACRTSARRRGSFWADMRTLGADQRFRTDRAGLKGRSWGSRSMPCKHLDPVPRTCRIAVSGASPRDGLVGMREGIRRDPKPKCQPCSKAHPPSQSLTTWPQPI